MKYIDAEKLIHDLEERIFAYSEGYAEGDDCRKDAIETLLKDVRYQCSLQQEQPHWKPSENQMSMLLAVVYDPNNAGSESCHLSLESLYNDLKKL